MVGRIFLKFYYLYWLLRWSCKVGFPYRSRGVNSLSDVELLKWRISVRKTVSPFLYHVRKYYFVMQHDSKPRICRPRESAAKRCTRSIRWFRTTITYLRIFARICQDRHSNIFCYFIITDDFAHTLTQNLLYGKENEEDKIEKWRNFIHFSKSAAMCFVVWK